VCVFVCESHIAVSYCLTNHTDFAFCTVSLSQKTAPTDRMPDPAMDAYKAGLDYTEPTGKGVRKAKVSYEWGKDPNNPNAPPRQRRIIEAAPRKSMLEKLFGGENGGQGNGGGNQQFAPIPVSFLRPFNL
jgi:hypothetical protein